jgi:hypothetical protein
MYGLRVVTKSFLPWDRFAVGFLAAWATEVAVSFAVGIIYAISSAGGLPSLKYSDAGSGIFFIALMFASVSAVFGFVATLTLGIPVLKAFEARGFVSSHAFFCAGLVIATVMVSMLVLWHRLGNVLDGADFDFAMAAVFISGPLAGLAFWSVHRRG